MMNNSKIDNVQPEQELNSEPAADVPTSSPSSTKPHVVRSAYYTPDISEFHFGFEFEVLNTKGKLYIPSFDEGVWIMVKVEFGVFGNLLNIHNLILDNQIRVKCLTKNDVESLGFTLYQIEGDSYEWEWHIKDKNDVGIGTFYADGGSQSIELYNANFVIRNKSELKCVLQQLGCVPS